MDVYDIFAPFFLLSISHLLSGSFYHAANRYDQIKGTISNPNSLVSIPRLSPCFRSIMNACIVTTPSFVPYIWASIVLLYPHHLQRI